MSIASPNVKAPTVFPGVEWWAPFSAFVFLNSWLTSFTVRQGSLEPRAKAGNTLEHLPVHHKAHTGRKTNTTTDNLESTLHLTCKFLDCGREAEYTGEFSTQNSARSESNLQVLARCRLTPKTSYNSPHFSQSGTILLPASATGTEGMWLSCFRQKVFPFTF